MQKLSLHLNRPLYAKCAQVKNNSLYSEYYRFMLTGFPIDRLVYCVLRKTEKPGTSYMESQIFE